MKRYLGIDWGEARIGLALGDDETKTASPLKVVTSVEGVIDEARREAADILVIGLPQLDFHKNAASGKKSQSGLNFVNKYDNFICLLKRDLKLPLEFVNENFTTRQAEKLPGNKKTKAEPDAIAAMLILQSFFDNLPS
jgi:RNase H-fold protein (predicted Holliday junction resolvase)